MIIELRLNKDLEQKDIFLVDENTDYEEMIGALYQNEEGEDVLSLTEDVTFEVYDKLYTVLVKQLNPSQTYACATKHTNKHKNLKADMGQGHQDSY